MRSLKSSLQKVCHFYIAVKLETVLWSSMSALSIHLYQAVRSVVLVECAGITDKMRISVVSVCLECTA